MLSSQEKQLMVDISGSKAFEHVSLLISPAERVSGSPAEEEGARKVRELLSPWVDSCELEGVAVTTYLRGEGKVEVTSPTHAAFPCQVNPRTVSGRGEGILLDISGGTIGDYQKAEGEVKGRIVLVTGDSAALGGGIGLIAREAKHRGAVCLVYHLTRREEDIMSVHGINIDFPVLSVSSQSATEMRRLLSQHKEVRVSFESNLTKASGTSYNVVGTIRGSQYPEEVIYLTSHHDTWFQGANDNNATTACLLEVAKLLAKQRPKRTVRFVIHGSEESGAEIGTDAGLFGSFGYTEFHRAQLEGKGGGEVPVCVINGEMIGYSPRSSMRCTPELLSFVKEVVADLEEEHLVNEPVAGWTSSDHLCYHTLGTPTIYLVPAPDPGTSGGSSYFRLYHTERDDLEHVSADALESNAKLLALLVARLDAAEVLPHSFEDLMAVAGRSMEQVPNSQRIKKLLEEKRAHCVETLSREERVRKTLELTRVVNKNIYGFTRRVFVHKFDTISDTVDKLRQAHSLIDAEGNLEGAREVLLTITGAAQVENFSHEVVEELERMRKTSALLNRLSTFSLDLYPLFDQIARGEPKETILSNLDSQIEQSLETARAWGVAFEQSLTTL